MISMIDIANKLKKIEVFIDSNSIRLYPEQGRVNEVYTCNSNKGKLIIQVGRHSDIIIQWHKVKRIYWLSNYLLEYTEIPIPEILTYGKEKYGKPFIIQMFIHGKKMSKIRYKRDYLIGHARILAKIHQIHLPRQ